MLLAGISLGSAYGMAVAGGASLQAPEPTPILLDRQGAFLAQLGHETAAGDGARTVEYGYWPVDPLPDRVARAALALEDRRFWHHPGVDVLAVARAGWGNLTGRPRSGASTIAMQVARMQAPAARTLWSKTVEAGTAILLTLRYGRPALLAHYLRLVPYGNGSHGIAHAARLYFDKPVQDLGWAEIALLSAIPQAPALHNPWRPDGLRRAMARGQAALAELSARGVLGDAELQTARAQLATIHLPPPHRRPDALHLVLRLRGMVERDGVAGLDPRDPRIRTTVDLGLQDRLAKLAQRQPAKMQVAGAEQFALMVLRRDNRDVVAALGSAGYDGTPGGAFDFTAAIRSPGSTLKPFLYAMALDRGVLSPNAIMADERDGASGIGNADGLFLGPILPRQALANSRNVPAVNLLRQLGLETALQGLRRLGLPSEGPLAENPAEHYGLSMAIGGLPTSLDRLVRAYGALADDGLLREPRWYDGQRPATDTRIFAPGAARQVALFLSDPQARLPSFPRYGHTEFPFAVALKTGTSQGYRDAWMVAWSRDWMVGGWVGRADAGPMLGLGGANAAGPLVQAAMLLLHETSAEALTDGGFPPPEGFVPVQLCAATGLADAGCGRTLVEWVPPGLMPAGPPVPVAMALEAPAEPRLGIASPENNSRLWRNPETPAALARLPLRASVGAGVTQVVWYVDDRPFAVARPGETVWWPLTAGAHRFQLRVPFGTAMSRPVRVVVE
jgi:penicillin-binding protein 1C